MPSKPAFRSPCRTIDYYESLPSSGSSRRRGRPRCLTLFVEQLKAGDDDIPKAGIPAGRYLRLGEFHEIVSQIPSRHERVPR